MTTGASLAYRDPAAFERKCIHSLVMLGLPLDALLARVESRRQAALHQREEVLRGIPQDERNYYLERIDAIIEANERAQEEIRTGGRLAAPDPDDGR